MKTMKKFFTYLIIFVLLYFIFDFLMILGTKGLSKDITNYTIDSNLAKVEITQSNATYSNINISGNITNNKDKLINKLYVRTEFYNGNGKYIGSEYKEIKNLNVGETQNFDLSYNYTNVGSFKVSTSEQIDEGQIVTETQFEKTIHKWWPVIGILTLIYFFT